MRTSMLPTTVPRVPHDARHRVRTIVPLVLATMSLGAATLVPSVAWLAVPPELYVALDRHQCRPNMRPGLPRAFQGVFDTAEDLLADCPSAAECQQELALALANLYFYLDFVSGDASPGADIEFPRAMELLAEEEALFCSRHVATYQWKKLWHRCETLGPNNVSVNDCTTAPEWALVRKRPVIAGHVPYPIRRLELRTGNGITGTATAKLRSDPLGVGYPLYIMSFDASESVSGIENAAEKRGPDGLNFEVVRRSCRTREDMHWDGIGPVEFWENLIHARLAELDAEGHLPITAAEIITSVNVILFTAP